MKRCIVTGKFLGTNYLELANGELIHPDVEHVVIDGDYYLPDDDLIVVDVYGDYQLEDDCVEIDGDWYRTDDHHIVYSELMEEYILFDESREAVNEGYATRTWLIRNNYVFLGYGSNSGYYIDRDETIYCVDIDDRVESDEAHYCEEDGEYYFSEDAMPQRQDGETICGYHDSPPPEDLSNGSQFRIGIEVEKNEIDGCWDTGEHIGEYRIFKGFEYDGSCGDDDHGNGVEAITNILPLDAPDSDNCKEVFHMIDSASRVIDAPVNGNCGGHMSVSARGLNSSELYEKIRIKSALLYAMYRFRLKNSYCSNNHKIDSRNNTKYSPVYIPGRHAVVEFRIFSRIRNTKQLKLRYELMWHLLDSSVNHPEESLADFIKRCKPVLNKLYNNNSEKIRTVISFTKYFYMFLKDRESSPAQEIRSLVNY